MSSISIDFTGLYVAAGIALVAALFATPLLWRLARGLPALSRAAVALLGALGLAGVASVVCMYELRDHELPGFALAATVLLQLLVLPTLLLLTRKTPKA